MYGVLTVSVPTLIVSTILLVFVVPYEARWNAMTARWVTLLAQTVSLVLFTALPVLSELTHQPRATIGVTRRMWLGIVVAHPLLWLRAFHVGDGNLLGSCLELSPTLLMLLSFGAAALYATRSRPRVGRCAYCDYDLTGNESGVCPECGRLIKRADHTQKGRD